MKAMKGDWVEVESLILNPSERASHLPEDTKKTPLMMWVKGFLNTEEANPGDEVEIITLAKRQIKGKLIDVKPRHKYDYGETIIELLHVGEELKKELHQILVGGEA